MGVMIDGVYRPNDTLTQTDASGNWQRAEMLLRHWVTPDGAAKNSPSGGTNAVGFKAESGRYHLFVAWNCPWAHRTLLARLLKGLNDHISISVALPRRTEQGWVFDAGGKDTGEKDTEGKDTEGKDTEGKDTGGKDTGDEFSDPLLGVRSLHQVYAMEPEPYTGRVTVPVLWDKKQKRIVSTESADIVRMLNTAFSGLVKNDAESDAENDLNLYPADLTTEIDRWNDLIYTTVNNGVYRAGFASSQEAYEAAARGVFETLDLIDAQLGKTRYLTGDRFTEADLRLFPTLARFDAAYFSAFKCNLRRLTDYANLWPYAKRIYQMDGVAETVRFDIYKRGYFSPSPQRNPFGIVPLGPKVDWGK